MKYRIILIAILAFNFHFLQAQVGIGTITPDASAALEINSTTQGILIPKMTETERDLISSPATGLMIYQTDNTPGFYYYDGSSWSTFGGGVEDGDAWGVTGEDSSSAIYRSGDVGIGTSGTPNSTLQVNGSFSLPIKSGTTAYTLTDSDYTYLTDGANVTLPTAVGREGRIYIIKNIGSSNQTLYPAPLSGQTIDGQISQDIRNNNRMIRVQCDGSDWWIIGEVN